MFFLLFSSIVQSRSNINNSMGWFLLFLDSIPVSAVTKVKVISKFWVDFNVFMYMHTPMCIFYILHPEVCRTVPLCWELQVALPSALCFSSLVSMLQAAGQPSCCFYMCLLLVVALPFSLLHFVYCGLENLMMMNFGMTSILDLSYFLPVWASSLEMPWEYSAWTLIVADFPGLCQAVDEWLLVKGSSFAHSQAGQVAVTSSLHPLFHTGTWSMFWPPQTSLSGRRSLGESYLQFSFEFFLSSYGRRGTMAWKACGTATSPLYRGLHSCAEHTAHGLSASGHTVIGSHFSHSLSFHFVSQSPLF